MEYRQLGKTGLRVSALCMGTMQFGWTAGEALSWEILQKGYEAGINFIDTANIYSRWVEGNPGGVSESIIGSWIARNSIPRDQLVLATKVRGSMGNGPNDKGLSRVHIMRAVEDSLERLNTDYIDLYQTHWFDEGVPTEETMDVLNDLVHQGKVRYIGCSNYPAWRLMESLWVSEKNHFTAFASIQPHYNLVHRDEFERELAEVCERYGIGVLPYSPLAGGFLTGKYQKDKDLPGSDRARGIKNRYFNEESWQVLSAAEAIAAEKAVSVSQIALAWQLTNPVITSPIIGPRSLAQLNDNIGAADLRLSKTEMESLNPAVSDH